MKSTFFLFFFPFLCLFSDSILLRTERQFLKAGVAFFASPGQNCLYRFYIATQNMPAGHILNHAFYAWWCTNAKLKARPLICALVILN